MNYTSKDLSPTKKQYTITLEASELETAKTQALGRLAKTVKVPGFRQGNVPQKVAEKHIDPMQLANETFEIAVNAALNDIVVKDDLRVLDRPSIDVKEFDPYTKLECTADIEILPDVRLGDYKKLTARKEVTTVTAKEVNEVIDRIRAGMADKNEVERPSKKDDEVVIDFTGYDSEDKLIDGAAGTDYTLKLGSDTFIPGFEEQLFGHKAGEEFDIEVTFPDDYHADHLKGAKVRFHINMKKVYEVTLPEVDDMLAKKAGPFETAKELKDDVRRELKAQNERNAEDKYKDDLLGELTEKSTVPLAEVLVHDQIHALEQDTMQNLMYRGMTLDQYIEAQGFKDKDDWSVKELRPAAERRVKSGLVLAELSKVEKIDISQDELEAALEQKKAEAPKMAAELDSPESRRDLANRLITEKTMQRIIDINTKK